MGDGYGRLSTFYCFLGRFFFFFLISLFWLVAHDHSSDQSLSTIPLKLWPQLGPQAALCALVDWLPHWWLATRSASNQARENTQGLPSVYTGVLRHELLWTCVEALHISLPFLDFFFLWSQKQSGPQASSVPLFTAWAMCSLRALSSLLKSSHISRLTSCHCCCTIVEKMRITFFGLEFEIIIPSQFIFQINTDYTFCL